MRKIQLKNQRYGCFSARYVCGECGKVLFSVGFSWSEDHICIGNEDKILEIMDAKAKETDMNFCFKCGVKTGESEGEE